MLLAGLAVISSAASAQSAMRDFPNEGIMSLEDHKSYFRKDQLYGIYDPQTSDEGRFHFVERKWFEQGGRVRMQESTERLTIAPISSFAGVESFLKKRLIVHKAVSEWGAEEQKFMWQPSEAGGWHIDYTFERWVSTIPTLKIEDRDALFDTIDTREETAVPYTTSSSTWCEFTEMEHYEVKCHYEYFPSGLRSVLYYWRIKNVVS